jgi:hypothetical protein
MAQARRTDTTTVRVTGETKALLDQLSGGKSMDKLLRELAMLRAGTPVHATPPGTYAIEIGEDDLPADFVERVERVERAVEGLAGLASLNVAALLSDPQTGVLFDITRAPSGDEKNGKEDGVILLPVNGEQFAREGSVGIFSDEPPAPGVWVRTPSGVYLTDRDDTLSDDLVVLVRRQLKGTRKGKRAKEES